MLAMKLRLVVLALLFVPLTAHAQSGPTFPAPETPRVELLTPEGAPLTIDGEDVFVPAIVDARGYPVFGPDGKLVPMPIAFGEYGLPHLAANGQPILLTGADHPRARLTDASGRPLKDSAGATLTAPALIGPDGHPVVRADGNLEPLAVVIDKDGRPVLSPNGLTILYARDIPDVLPLLDSDGNVIIGPVGPLMIPIERDSVGRPVLGVDGHPMRVAIKTNHAGQPLLGTDGQPIPAPSDEEAKEDIVPMNVGMAPMGSAVLFNTIVLIALIGCVYLIIHVVRRRLEA